MGFNQLHFAYPLLFWLMIIIPIVWILYAYSGLGKAPTERLSKFIDSHLLPYLLKSEQHSKGFFWAQILAWTMAWTLLTIALAGPRWDLREIESFSKDQSLVILLDLSESMNATDIVPSRLIRAKQKIEDLLNSSQGVKIGLIAFAADPHMIAPLTDDVETIRHLLQSLSTDLVYLQGSRLTPALEMALQMLKAEPGSNKALLVISDGGFEDASAILTAKQLASQGFVVHTMGMATSEGALIQDQEGHVMKREGVPVISRLENENLAEISEISGGHYLEFDDDENAVLADLDRRAAAQMALGQKKQIWDEGFYFFILPTLPILLWWFRRGHLFALLLFLPAFNLQGDLGDYFSNSEQRGQAALESGANETAAEAFQDPYRKGVAYYRAGNFAEAEKMFRASTRPNVASSAAYNLGNALAQQGKLKEAIAAYEALLEVWPDHLNAEENLELLKKMAAELEPPPNEGSDKNQKKEDSEKTPSFSSEDAKEEGKEQKSQTNQNSADPSQSSEAEPSQPDSSTTPEPAKNRSPEENLERQGTEQSSNKPTEAESELEEKEASPSDQKTQPSFEESEQPGLSEVEAPAEQKKGSAENKSQEISEEVEKKNGSDAFHSEGEQDQQNHVRDQEADIWLNRLANDPKIFMRNKFYLESKRSGTKQGIEPW